jgi:hypothetical protein
MPHPSKTKGDRAELELQRLLSDLSGWPVRRKLGAGRSDDSGDLDGLPDCCVQVKNYYDPRRAIAEILAELPAQHTNSGLTFAAGFFRRRGARWGVVMTPEMFVALLREANPGTLPPRDSELDF